MNLKIKRNDVDEDGLSSSLWNFQVSTKLAGKIIYLKFR